MCCMFVYREFNRKTFYVRSLCIHKLADERTEKEKKKGSCDLSVYSGRWWLFGSERVTEGFKSI